MKNERLILLVMLLLALNSNVFAQEILQYPQRYPKSNEIVEEHSEYKVSFYNLSKTEYLFDKRLQVIIEYPNIVEKGLNYVFNAKFLPEMHNGDDELIKVSGAHTSAWIVEPTVVIKTRNGIFDFSYSDYQLLAFFPSRYSSSQWRNVTPEYFKDLIENSEVINYENLLEIADPGTPIELRIAEILRIAGKKLMTSQNPYISTYDVYDVFYRPLFVPIYDDPVGRVMRSVLTEKNVTGRGFEDYFVVKKIGKYKIDVDFYISLEYYKRKDGKLNLVGKGKIEDNIEIWIECKPENKILITKPNYKTIWYKNDKNYNISWKADIYNSDEPMKITINGTDWSKDFIAPNTGCFNIITLPESINEGQYSIIIKPVYVNPFKSMIDIKGTSDVFWVRNENVLDKANNIQPLRTSYAGRNVTYVKEINVSSTDIQIRLYDHQEIDGDIVSIYLNGLPIIKNYTLTGSYKTIPIKLIESQRNDIFLFAHNVGTLPPNTVAIEIVDNNKVNTVVLHSNLQGCEAIVIYVE